MNGSKKKHKNLSLESVHVTNIYFLFSSINLFSFVITINFLYSYIFFVSLKIFQICIHLYALLWKTNEEILLFCGTVKKKGSDDNYLARYNKIIVTRSIFISLLLSSTLQCPGSFHHQKDYEWWCNFFPREVSIEKQFFTKQ